MKIPKILTILGSTGSIGQSALEIVNDNPNDFNIYALSGYQNIMLLYKQCLKFLPKYTIVKDELLAKNLKHKLVAAGCKTTVLFGADKLEKIAGSDTADIVIAAIVGIAGLKPTYAAIKAGKTILLANKESLISAGKIFISAVRKYDATLLPIDSEHSAIFQCLHYNSQKNIEKKIDKIILTASGGPFYQKKLHELKNITPKEAVAHPNWKMGKKISVDSSTMMNKALEIIEAYWFFSLPVDKIEILIHPESIVHSLVKYYDGNFIAQMSIPDMKIPINYALYYPRRHNIKAQYLDLTKKPLNFFKLNEQRFKIVSLTRTLLKSENYSSNIVLNAANEILVEAFLEKKIQYLQIVEYIEQTVNKLDFFQPSNIDDVIDIDLKTKEFINTKFCLNIPLTIYNQG